MIYFITFSLALGLALALTPVARLLAHRLSVMDHPDGRRKVHQRSTPLGGGLAVFVATCLAALISLAIYAYTPGVEVATETWRFLMGLALASTVICLIGLLDDYLGLSGPLKLLGQTAAVTILVLNGTVFDKIGVGGVTIPLDILAVPITFFWCLGAINAINLLDGADGLASSIGLVLCLTLGAFTAMQGSHEASLVCLALGGALLGFLRFNFPPASIFLGDAGSMLIGLVVSALAVECSFKGPTAVALSVPLAIWAIPILDSVAAIIRRKLTGRSVFATDRGHLHHRLLQRGWSVQKTVLVVVMLCVVSSVGALVSAYLGNEYVAIGTMFIIFILLVSSRLFGDAELKLINNFFRHTVGRLLGRRNGESAPSETCVHLQGDRDWEAAWRALVEAATRYRVERLKLCIDIPDLHETFYGSWSAPDGNGVARPHWRIELPLTAREQLVGTLVVVGNVHQEIVNEMSAVLDFLEPLEEHLHGIVEYRDAEQADAKQENNSKIASIDEPPHAIGSL